MTTNKAVSKDEVAKNAHVVVTHSDSSGPPSPRETPSETADDEKTDNFVYSHGLDDQGIQRSRPCD
jgi:hypothetical protein